MPQLSPKKDLPKSRIVVTVTFSPEETAAMENVALRKLSQNVRVDGFRQGQAPADLVKQKVHPDELFDRMLRDALPKIFSDIIERDKVEPILAPSVQVKKTEPIEIDVTFVEKPDVKVKGVDKIKVAKEEPKADQKDVDRMVSYLQRQYQSTKEIDEAAKEGHQVTMNFAGKDTEGKEIPGTRSTNYSVVIGSKSLIPGFEDNLVGLKKGDLKSFTVTFPDKYHAEHLRGKPAIFDVEVTGVHEVHTPEMDDAFVKEHQIAESRAEMEHNIRTSLIAEEERANKTKRENELFDKIREATKVDLADEMIDAEARSIAENLGQQLQDQQMTLDQWLEAQHKTADQLQKELRDEATKRLTLRFGIEKILEEKQIDVSDEEMDGIIKDAETRHSHHDHSDGHTHDFSKGSHEYEQFKWQKKIEKMMEMMLS